MERTEDPARPRGSADHTGHAGAPAHRDAAAILVRATEDEAAADEARERYRIQAMPALEPDARVAALLGPDEQVVAVRRSVFLDRRHPSPGTDAPTGLGGDLYVTSRRLLLAGRLTLSFELDRIDDVLLSGERLLVVMRDGQGASIEGSGPRLLRVEIAAARAAARR